MKRSIPSQGSPIAGARQIRALASPIRQDILDALTAIGPCSVSELAAAIGRPADGLYYHIRHLLKAG
jgi:predicted transcriptional regulator